MYECNEHAATVNKLLKILKDEQLFFSQRTSLSEVLKEKVSNMRYYYEQLKIIA